MRDEARRHGCTFTLPFDQKQAMQSILARISGVEAHLDPPSGFCLGLSFNWLKNAVKGHSDAQFSQSLKDWEKDPLFIRVAGVQQIEQGNARSNAKSGIDVVKSTLPSVGLDKAGEAAVNLSRPDFNKVLEQTIGAMSLGESARYFVLTSDKHAMAMRKDESGCLHFFDPNGGVISSHNPRAMAHVVGDALLMHSRNWLPGGDRVLQIVEAKPAGEAQG